MHGTLFLGMSKENIKSSIAARRLAYEYLEEEGFATQTRFAGCADVFGVGWRSSGILQLLRLRHDQPKLFKKFWKQYCASEDAAAVFKRSFPEYRGRLPVLRQEVPSLGFPDDAQILDDTLYECLHKGFKDSFSYSWGIDEKPCVLHVNEWPETRSEIVDRTWVVVVGYKV